MTDEQKKLLAELQAKSNLSAEETTQLSDLATLAAEEVGGDTYKNSGYTEQFLNTTFDQFNMFTPLVMDFMKSEAELMTQPVVSMDYYLITQTVDASVNPGDCPDSVGTTTRKVSIGFGKLWLKDEILKEDLIARINQVTQLGKTLMSDGSSANPVNTSKKKLLSLLVRNFESKAWNGDVNDKGIGIVGLKTQHTKLNSTTTTAMGSDNVTVAVDAGSGTNADGRYNKVNYTSSAEGKNAFAVDLYGRIKALYNQYGANHFTLYVPTGAGPTVRAALADYEKVSLILQQLIVNSNGDGSMGSKAGIFSDNEGRSYVNPLLDVKEIDGLVDGEAYLYPDTVFGEWTYKYLEYGLAGKPLPGIQTYISGLNLQMQNITGLNPAEVSEMCMCNDGRCDVFTLSLQWTGQIVAQAVGMATLYTRVQFIKAFAAIDVTDKTTGQVNLSAVV